MKVFTDAAMAAIVNGTAVTHGALLIACVPPLKVWTGYGELPDPADADNPFIGVGNNGSVKNSSAALGGSAQAMSLVLSGVDPDLLPLLDADLLQGAPTVIWKLIFDGSGTVLLDSHVFTRGRVDLVQVEETARGEATITVTVEGAARTLGRRGGRMRTDADQRLIDASDGGFKHVSYAAEKTLYWGGQPPANAGAATGGRYSAAGLAALQQRQSVLMPRDYAAYHRYMAARLVMPFVWGRDANDCISHGAGAIVAQTRRDALVGLNWTSKIGAARLIAKHGGLEAMISARLAPVAPAHAHRGDIGAVAGDVYLGGLAIVVIDGAMIIGPGGMRFPRSALSLAWSID